MVRFAELLKMVAVIHPDLRVRFSTSHPKDMTDDVLHAMSRHENICKYIHLPVQSGHSDVLKRMNRGYTREWYLDRIAAIRASCQAAPSAPMSSQASWRNPEEHEATLSLMDEVRDMAFMFVQRAAQNPCRTQVRGRRPRRCEGRPSPRSHRPSNGARKERTQALVGRCKVF